MSTLKMLSLFSGIGGIDLAAQWAGIETVAFCEINEFCQKVLKKHWPTVPIWSDIRELSEDSLRNRGINTGSIDIIAGGFPCQPFSVAGKQRGKEDDRHLWPEMFRIIREIRPRWVVGENVANFVNMALDDTLADLENEGYSSIPFLIPACSVGAKHKRNRIFIVAHSNSLRELQLQRDIKKFRGWTCDSGKEMAHADSSGFQAQRVKTRIRETQRETRSGIERGSLLGKERDTNWWNVEPNVGRVANGVPNRLDRIKSLGNAVVPQQICPIFKAITDIENNS